MLSSYVIRSSHHSVMDCSRVIQSLDSLWFYTNILTFEDGQQVADDSFTDDQTASKDRFTATTEANDDVPFPLNQKIDYEPEKVIESSMITSCYAKCGRVSNDIKADEKLTAKSNDNSDDEGLKSRREREKRKKRRKKNRTGVHEIQQQIEKTLPPFDDDVAMKEHLRLWAYAVGCRMQCQMKQYEMWRTYNSIV